MSQKFFVWNIRTAGLIICCFTIMEAVTTTLLGAHLLHNIESVIVLCNLYWSSFIAACILFVGIIKGEAILFYPWILFKFILLTLRMFFTFLSFAEMNSEIILETTVSLIVTALDFYMLATIFALRKQIKRNK